MVHLPALSTCHCEPPGPAKQSMDFPTMCGHPGRENAGTASRRRTRMLRDASRSDILEPRNDIKFRYFGASVSGKRDSYSEAVEMRASWAAASMGLKCSHASSTSRRRLTSPAVQMALTSCDRAKLIAGWMCLASSKGRYQVVWVLGRSPQGPRAMDLMTMVATSFWRHWRINSSAFWRKTGSAYWMKLSGKRIESKS